MLYKVLVGEDTPEIREYLTGVLNKEGYDITSSSTPEGVFRRIDNVDLLVTDQSYGRRKISGIDMARRVRGSSKRNLPIILASSEITPKMEEICKELGIKGVKKNIEDKGFKNTFLEEVRDSLNI